MTLREQAIDAAKQAINAGGYWLPPAGQEAAVDAVLELIRLCPCGNYAGSHPFPGCLTEGPTDAAELQPASPDAANNDLAWTRRMLLEAQAEATAEATRADQAETELEASQRRAVRIQTLLDDTRDRIRKLHRPVEYRGRVICVECSGYCGESTDNGPFEHPCATVAALEPPKETPDA